MSAIYRNLLEKISRTSRKNRTLKKVARSLRYFKASLNNLKSDEKFAKQMYKKYTGDELNLGNPQNYNEKLWWLKFHYRNPLQTIFSDKYRVREYVKQCGLEEILVQLYGVYDDARDIIFDEFTHEVFLKVNSGSGGNIIYNPKKDFDKKTFVWDFNSRLKHNCYLDSREWNYKNVPAKIVCEEVLRDSNGQLPKDYKFMCFGGEPKLLFYSDGVCDEKGMHSVEGQRFTNVYDMDFHYIDMTVDQPSRPDICVQKPETFEKMKEYATILSRPFPQCRVDFYTFDGRVYFGEITFYHGGGCRKIKPEKWMLQMGQWIDLDSIKKEHLI